MLRTLLVFGALLAVVAVVRAAREPATERVRRVDAQLADAVATARRLAGFRVVSPSGLPAAWAPTSAAYTSSVPALGGRPLLHAGWVTPSGAFAALEESDTDVIPALDRYDGPDPRAVATTTVAGVRYLVKRAAGGVVTLTGRLGAAQVGVTGGAPQRELEQLLGSLR